MKLSDIRLAKSLCQRIPYNILAMSLKKIGINHKRGGDAIEEKLTDLLGSKNISSEKLEALHRLYENYLKFGDKTVTISTINATCLRKLLLKIDDIKHTLDPNKINFPYFDSSTDKYLSNTPKLVSIERSDDGVLLSFSSLKSLVEKVELDVNYFNQINASFQLPDELYDITAKRMTKRRYYDCVFIRLEDSTIEFRLDTASLISKVDLVDSLQNLKTAFVKIVRELIDESELGLKTVNLFTAIPSTYIYSENRVCELGFTVGSVIHHEKMRSSNKDLRKELFHKGGKESIDKLEIQKDGTAVHKPAFTVFRIAVRIKKHIGMRSYETEAYLPGIAKMMQSASMPLLEYVIISNCTNESDYNEHISSLKSHMKTYKESLLQKAC